MRDDSSLGLLVTAAICVTASCPPLDAADALQQSRFTEVVNIVEVLPPQGSPAALARRPRVNDIFRSPEILQTGRASRAELLASDATVTRIGANSVFSFEQNKERSIFLQRGSILFHSPKGRGGGTIRTASATASVLGTTIIVVATNNGGFKVMVLEGKAKVTLPNGRYTVLREGQLVFVLPGSKQMSPALTFRLAQQMKGAQLVQGFENPLGSLEKILSAANNQERFLQDGRIENTGLLIGETDNGTDVVLVRLPDAAIEGTIIGGSNPGAGTLPSADPVTTPPVDPVVDTPVDPGPWQFHLPGTVTTLAPDPPEHLISGQRLTPNTLDPPSLTARTALDNALAGTRYANLGNDTAGTYDQLFVGNGVSFDPAAPTIDLSPFTSANRVRFVSISDMTIPGSLTFSGYTGEMGLYANGSINIAAGSSINAGNAALLALDSGFAIALNDVGLFADYGNILIDGGSTISLLDGSFRASDQIQIGASTFATIDGTVFNAPSINITGFDVSLLDADLSGVSDTLIAAARSLSIQATSGDLTLDGTTASAGFQTYLAAPGQINILGDSSIQGQFSLALDAGTSVSIQGSELTSANWIVIDAATSTTIDDATISSPYLGISGDGSATLNNTDLSGVGAFYCQSLNGDIQFSGSFAIPSSQFVLNFNTLSGLPPSISVSEQIQLAATGPLSLDAVSLSQTSPGGYGIDLGAIGGDTSADILTLNGTTVESAGVVTLRADAEVRVLAGSLIRGQSITLNGGVVNPGALQLGNSTIQSLGTGTIVLYGGSIGIDNATVNDAHSITINASGGTIGDDIHISGGSGLTAVQEIRLAADFNITLRDSTLRTTDLSYGRVELRTGLDGPGGNITIDNSTLDCGSTTEVTAIAGSADILNGSLLRGTSVDVHAHRDVNISGASRLEAVYRTRILAGRTEYTDGPGGDVTLNNATIDPVDVIDIRAAHDTVGGNINIGGGSDLTAVQEINLTADFNIALQTSILTQTAPGGIVKIEAGDSWWTGPGGNVDIGGMTIGCYNLGIRASGGSVRIAGGSQITAYRFADAIADTWIEVSGSTIQTLDSGGESIDLNTGLDGPGGDITIENSTLDSAAGGISLDAVAGSAHILNGSVLRGDNDVEVHADRDVNISGASRLDAAFLTEIWAGWEDLTSSPGGNVTINNAIIDPVDMIDIRAYHDTVGGNIAVIGGSTLTAAQEINLAADFALNLQNSTFTQTGAAGLGITLNAADEDSGSGSGMASIDIVGGSFSAATKIEAHAHDGHLDISGGTQFMAPNMVQFRSRTSATLSQFTISQTTPGGSVQIGVSSGNLDVSAADIVCGGTLQLEAPGGSIRVWGNSQMTANEELDLLASTSLEVRDSTLRTLDTTGYYGDTIQTGVEIWTGEDYGPGGDITIDNSTLDSAPGTGVYAVGGNANILNGSVLRGGTYLDLHADQNVNISGASHLDAATRTEIWAGQTQSPYGSRTFGPGGDVSIDNAFIDPVDVIDIRARHVTVGGNINIIGGSSLTAAQEINLAADFNVTLQNCTLTQTAADGQVNILAGGEGFGSAGNVDISGTTIDCDSFGYTYAGDGIRANGGSVRISGSSQFTANRHMDLWAGTWLEVTDSTLRTTDTVGFFGMPIEVGVRISSGYNYGPGGDVTINNSTVDAAPGTLIQAIGGNADIINGSVLRGGTDVKVHSERDVIISGASHLDAVTTTEIWAGRTEYTTGPGGDVTLDNAMIDPVDAINIAAARGTVGGNITINGSSTLTANQQINLQADFTLDLQGSALTQTDGSGPGISLNAGLSPNGGDVNLTSASVDAASTLAVQANRGTVGGNINVAGGTLGAVQSVNLVAGANANVSGATIQQTGASGTLHIESRDGDVDIQTTSLTGHEVLVSSANPAAYQIVRMNLLNGSINGARTELVARDMLTVNGTSLGVSLTDIRMQADTLALQNINFPGGSSVNLGSRLGLLAPNANTGQPVLNGYVNYVDEVRYNGTLLDNNPHGNINIYAIP